MTEVRDRAMQIMLCATAFVLLVTSPALAAHCPPEVGDGVPETCPAEALSEVVEVVMQTSLGTIRLGLFPGVAPLTVANFLSYMESGDYDNLFFHRTFVSAELDIIQAGAFAFEDGVVVTREPGPIFVCNEPCIKNERGTIAMAKLATSANSAKNQWFINVNDSPAIDPNVNGSGGFTVFGRVLEGMDVVDAIGDLSARLPSRTVMSLYTDLDYNAILPAIPDMPLLAELEEAPQGYGCFNTANIGAEVFTGETLIEPPLFIPDPLTNFFSYVSLDCSDPKEPDPVVQPGDDCSAEGTCLRSYDVQTEELGTSYIVVTEQARSRSDSGLALLRTDMITQLDENAVHVTVPEPNATAARLLVIGSLGYLASRRKKAQH